MVKKEVRYTDFNGKPQVEEVYFNLSEVELVRLDTKLHLLGGLRGLVDVIAENPDPALIMNVFEELLSTAYGERSEDGKHFFKNSEKTELFKQSAAYSALFTEFLTDETKAANFFTAVVSMTSGAPAPIPPTT